MLSLFVGCFHARTVFSLLLLLLLVWGLQVHDKHSAIAGNEYTRIYAFFFSSLISKYFNANKHAQPKIKCGRWRCAETEEWEVVGSGGGGGGGGVGGRCGS